MYAFWEENPPYKPSEFEVLQRQNDTIQKHCQELNILVWSDASRQKLLFDVFCSGNWSGGFATGELYGLMKPSQVSKSDRLVKVVCNDDMPQGRGVGRPFLRAICKLEWNPGPREIYNDAGVAEVSKEVAAWYGRGADDFDYYSYHSKEWAKDMVDACVRHHLISPVDSSKLLDCLQEHVKEGGLKQTDAVSVLAEPPLTGSALSRTRSRSEIGLGGGRGAASPTGSISRHASESPKSGGAKPLPKVWRS